MLDLGGGGRRGGQGEKGSQDRQSAHRCLRFHRRAPEAAGGPGGMQKERGHRKNMIAGNIGGFDTTAGPWFGYGANTKICRWYYVDK